MTYRILVTGSRYYTDSATVEAMLREALGTHDPSQVILIHGDAPGLDRLAAAVAVRLGMTVESRPADWARHGRAAGPIRNREMVALGADMCLAFPLGGSQGTWDCVSVCRQAGIPVRVIGGNQADGGQE